ELKTVKLLRLAPGAPGAALAGKLVVAAAVSAVALAAALLAIVFVYGVVPVAPWTTAAALLACVAIFTCMGAWVGAILKRTLAAWLRSPAAIGAALLPALGMGVLVAVLTNSVGQQPVALVIQGHGRFADRMARILKADAGAYLLEEMDSAGAERAIGDQRVAA